MGKPDDAGRVTGGPITVRCRFFATFAELLGREGFDLVLPGAATVGDAVQALREALPHGERLPQEPMTAVNREHARPGHPLADGDELALLPPLAGG